MGFFCHARTCRELSKVDHRVCNQMLTLRGQLNSFRIFALSSKTCNKKIGLLMGFFGHARTCRELSKVDHRVCNQMLTLRGQLSSFRILVQLVVFDFFFSV
jgi:hypothetical protein